jgi:hypothetical protein
VGCPPPEGVDVAHPQVLELIFVIGYQIFVSWFANAFGIAPHGFAERAQRTTVSAS